MGASHGNFVKYPRTPHLFGSVGTSDDRHLNERQSEELLQDASLVIEEKLDGTNVGLHFDDAGVLLLQCRGHLITSGMHPQYDLFKQWAEAKRQTLFDCLGARYILYGEWMYARHTILYRALPHYFFEFDCYDKQQQCFLPFEKRMKILDGTGLHTVPILHRGSIKRKQLQALVGDSAFNGHFENPNSHRSDHLMEGLYLRTESEFCVTNRAKLVRPEFVEKIKQSRHWQQQQLVPNQLEEGADLFR